MQSGSVPYNVTGDITVGTPVGNFTVPYSGTGRFSAFGGAQNNDDIGRTSLVHVRLLLNLPGDPNQVPDQRNKCGGEG